MSSTGFIEEELTEKLDTTIPESDDESDFVTSTKSKTENSLENDSQSQTTKPGKKRKKGIIYISNIPKHMNVMRLREYLGQYGDIGRVYLQPEKLPDSKKKAMKKKKHSRHFTEGWLEFESKRVAKKVAEMLNNTQIGTRKRSQFYDSLWSIKYLPRFKWIHLSERMRYEQAVHKQRLQNEASQARKEANFFQSKLDKSESIRKKNKKVGKS